jgi:hypothetical protein
VLPTSHWLYSQFRKGYGTCLRRLGEYDLAERELLAALDGLQRELGEGHRRVLQTVAELVELYRDTGREADAERLAERLKDDG